MANLNWLSIVRGVESDLVYTLAGSRIWPKTSKLVFSADVLTVFDQYRQISDTSPESGGQLFGTFRSGILIVCVATVPKAGDLQTRYSFKPESDGEQADILYQFEQGNHYIGDWHTHPEDRPKPCLLYTSPSPRDQRGSRMPSSA